MSGRDVEVYSVTLVDRVHSSTVPRGVRGVGGRDPGQGRPQTSGTTTKNSRVRGRASEIKNTVELI